MHHVVVPVRRLVQEQPTRQDIVPAAQVRWIGRAAGAVQPGRTRDERLESLCHRDVLGRVGREMRHGLPREIEAPGHGRVKGVQVPAQEALLAEPRVSPEHGHGVGVGERALERRDELAHDLLALAHQRETAPQHRRRELGRAGIDEREAEVVQPIRAVRVVHRLARQLGEPQRIASPRELAEESEPARQVRRGSCLARGPAERGAEPIERRAIVARCDQRVDLRDRIDRIDRRGGTDRRDLGSIGHRAHSPASRSLARHSCSRISASRATCAGSVAKPSLK